MQTILIISMATIFLTWLYIHQKRLAAYERYCMYAYKLSQTQKYIQASNFADAMNRLSESTRRAAKRLTIFKNSLENQPTVSK